MSLDVTIIYKEPKRDNYFLNHPYYYSYLSDKDKNDYYDEAYWSGNITHNLGQMANNVPIEYLGTNTTLYKVCWRPEEINIGTTDEILPLLIEGIKYMVEHRKDLLQYESPNGWGTYEGFMKFLLNYKQACEDNPNCKIEASR